MAAFALDGIAEDIDGLFDDGADGGADDADDGVDEVDHDVDLDTANDVTAINKTTDDLARNVIPENDQLLTNDQKDEINDLAGRKSVGGDVNNNMLNGLDVDAIDIYIEMAIMTLELRRNIIKC